MDYETNVMGLAVFICEGLILDELWMNYGDSFVARSVKRTNAG